MSSPPHRARRSSRVQVKIAVLLTSLEPTIQYSEVCEALVVNAHGCAMRSPKPLESGLPVQLRTRGGGQTKARIVASQCIVSGNDGWMLGVSLDKPGNFWGLMPCPEDWLRAPGPHQGQNLPELLQPLAAPLSSEAGDLRMRASSLGDSDARYRVDPNTRTTSQRVQNLGSPPTPGGNIPGEKELLAGRYALLPQGREQLNAIVAELIQPLQTNLIAVREKLAETEHKRSEFDQLLAQIPSAVEERLWIRLRQYVDAAIVEKTGPLQSGFTAMGSQLATVLPLGQDVTKSLRDLSTKIDAADAGLQALVLEQRTAQQRVEQIEERIRTVGRLANDTAEQLAGVMQLVRAQIADQQDHFSTVTRGYAEDLEALKQFRIATDAALRQITQVQAGFSGLCDEVSQTIEKRWAFFEREVERQISEQSEQTLSAAKAFHDEQGAICLACTQEAATYLKEIEARTETLKAHLQKTTTDAQQQTFSVFEHHMNCAHDEVRKWISDELQAFDSRTQVLSESLAGRMRQELCEAVSQDREGIRAWLEQQREDIRRMIHDAAVKANAEINARHYMNLEMSKNSSQDLQQEIIGQLQERARRVGREFEELIGEQLGNIRNTSEASVAEAVRVQVAESMKSFASKLEELAEESITRCRFALAQDLKSIANTLDMQLQQKSMPNCEKQKPSPLSNGDGCSTRE